MPNCPRLTYEIADTAALYSALTGVLAGFAFTALVLIVTVRSEGGGRIVDLDAFARPLRLLLATFIALVFTSLNYAVLAGDRSNSGRAASSEAIAGMSFAVSGLLLVLCIAVLLRAAAEATGEPQGALGETSDFANRVLLGVSPAVVALVYLGLSDYSRIRYSGRITYIDYCSYALLLIILVLTVLAWRFPQLLRFSRLSKLGLLDALATFALVVSVLATVGASLVLSNDDVCKTTNRAVPLIAMLVISALSVALILYLSADSEVDVENKAPANSGCESATPQHPPAHEPTDLDPQP